MQPYIKNWKKYLTEAEEVFNPETRKIEPTSTEAPSAPDTDQQSAGRSPEVATDVQKVMDLIDANQAMKNALQQINNQQEFVPVALHLVKLAIDGIEGSQREAAVRDLVLQIKPLGKQNER